MDDSTDFVISIGCDTVFLLRKYFCVGAEKSSILRKFLSGVHRGFEFLGKRCIMNEVGNLEEERIMLRKATMQDIPRIAEIIVFGKRVAYRPIFKNDDVSFNELQVINLIDEYRNSPAQIENMLVYDDGIVKGVINRNFTDDVVEICELYVEPFFKGNGIGKKLIQQVIMEARECKFNKIFLWVIEENLSARKFYENNGFTANGETCLIEGTTKTDMCYELLL